MAFVFGFFSVAIVLSAGCKAEVGLSIIQAVMVDVVNHESGRDIYYLAVHID